MNQTAIDCATRARLGVLVTSGNTVAEPNLPTGVGLPLPRSPEAELLAGLGKLFDTLVRMKDAA